MLEPLPAESPTVKGGPDASPEGVVTARPRDPVLRCPGCDRHYPVSGWRPGQDVFCPACRTPLAAVQLEAPIDVSRPQDLPVLAEAEGEAVEVRSFGRYRLLKELGRGGMGRVFKAWDSSLKRVVALKQILPGGHGGSEAVERFMREARLAARLHHPNIVGVHDVGVWEGQHYLTTDFVDGAPLDEVEELPVPASKAVAWVRGIAEALDYAHKSGVVHRDVKPQNVLVDAAGTPYVMDFGLAKEVAIGGEEHGERLTLCGQILGTPAFMSPEQVEGDPAAIGPATDQYALGVVFYQLLTGTLPFEGRTLPELLCAIMDQELDPPSRRRPRIHRDIEAICMKALEKDSRHRYGSLADLAADLRRYADGEPIHARPVSLVARLVRRAAKRKGALAAIAATLLLGGGAWAWAAATRRAAIETEKQAETRMADAERVEASARTALEKSDRVSRVLARWARLEEPLRRLEAAFHDASLDEDAKRKAAQADWPAFEAFLRDTPEDSASRACARALAGWARRLAGDPVEGAAWMEEAASIDPDIPLPHLMRALALFSQYEAKAPLSGYHSWGTGIVWGRAFEEPAELAEVRARIGELLDRAAGSHVWGKAAAKDFESAVEGVRALQRGDHAEAVEALSTCLDAPDLKGFETGLLYARAKARMYTKQFEAALEDLGRVLEARPRDAEALLFRVRVRFMQAVEGAVRGEDPRETLEEALCEADRALAIDAGYGDALHERSQIRVYLAESELARGRDPRDLLRRALEDLARLRGEGQELAEIHCGRGTTHLMFGMSEAACGLDPSRSYLEAVAAFGRAIEVVPDSATARGSLLLARMKLADHRMSRGEDVREELERAIAGADEAVRACPRDSGLLDSRGAARNVLARAETSRGGDPRPILRLALADLDAALDIDPRYVVARHNRGNAWRDLGKAQALRGEDPSEAYGEAIAEYGRAIELNRSYADAWLNRGLTLVDIGTGELEAGRDGAPRFREALGDYDRALEIRPGDAVALRSRGAARRMIGEAEWRRGEDPRASFRSAIEDYDAVIAAQPAWAEAYNSRGNAWRSLGDDEHRRGVDTSTSYGRAIEDFGRAAELDPSNWMPHANRGLVHEALGRAEDAEACYEAALRLCPGQPLVQRRLDALRARPKGPGR